MLLVRKRRIITQDAWSTRIWDAVNGEEIAVLRGHERALTDLALSHNDLRIATASHDNMTRIYFGFLTDDFLTFADSRF